MVFRYFFLSLPRKPRITGNAEEQPANVGASGTAVYLVEGVRFYRPLYSLAIFVISTLHNADSRRVFSLRFTNKQPQIPLSEGRKRVVRSSEIPYIFEE